uniref:Uncharacterized protein n=1 Tax=Plectus sambesii TaxID=2011161 RepID=A0A914XMD4_9BILA
MARFVIVVCVCLLLLQKIAGSVPSEDEYFVVTELYKGDRYLERFSFPYDLEDRELPIEYKHIGTPDAICAGSFIFKGNEIWKVLSDREDWNIRLGRPDPIAQYFPNFDGGVDAALCVKHPASTIETVHLFKDDYYQNFTILDGFISVESGLIPMNISQVDAAFLFNIVTEEKNDIFPVIVKGDTWYKFEAGFPEGGSLYDLFFDKLSDEEYYYADGISAASHYFYL